MGTIGLGYGSEYQLLRMLGHHRNEFFAQLSKELKIKSDINWLDYTYDSKSVSLDGELQAVQCFEYRPDYDVIFKEWKNFWPQQGTQQSWDGIFTADDKWYFVEAKAHLGEASTDKRTTNDSSIKKIQNAFVWTIQQLNINNRTGEDWFKSPFYQLANRLSFIEFCRNKFNINAELLYIHFVDGYEKPGLSCNGRPTRSVIKEDKGVKTSKEWEDLWSEELSDLGLTEVPSFVHQVTVNCNR